MEQTAKFVVFRNTESGNFLVDYKSRGSLAYEANYSDAIQHASAVTVEAFEDQRDEMEALAKGFGCEVLIVEGTYSFKLLNGEDAKEIEMTEEAKRAAAFRSFLDMLGE